MAKRVIQPARRILPPVNHPRFQNEAQQALDDLSNAVLPLTRQQQSYDITFGTTCTPNLILGSVQRIVATNGKSFAVAKPQGVNDTHSKAGQVQPPAHWTLIIENSSGGTMGNVTFDPSLLATGFVAPASGQSSVAQFATVTDSKGNATFYQVGAWTLVGIANVGNGSITKRNTVTQPRGVSVNIPTATLTLVMQVGTGDVIHTGDLLHLTMHGLYSVTSGTLIVSWWGNNSQVKYTGRSVTSDSDGNVNETVAIVSPNDGDTEILMQVRQGSGSPQTLSGVTASIVNFQKR